MRDEIDSRIWLEHHQDFSEGLDRLFGRIGSTVSVALRRLNEMEFDAPWKRDVRGPGQA